jgi:hypothetical protein
VLISSSYEPGAPANSTACLGRLRGDGIFGLGGVTTDLRGETTEDSEEMGAHMSTLSG